MWKTYLKDVITELNAVRFDVYGDYGVKFLARCKKLIAAERNTGVHLIMTFLSMMNCIYEGGPISL
jgi:hypothetical protein